jgi:hypothetical protein
MLLMMHRTATLKVTMPMTETELHSKLDEIDRLLNDPETSLEASRVWSLLAEVSLHDGQVNPARM